MNVFQLISRIQAISPQTRDSECIEILRVAQREAVNAVGGARNPKLRPYLESQVTGTLTPSNNFVILPHDAGEILSIRVDGEPADVLSASTQYAATENAMYSRSGVQIGNRVEFPGINLFLKQSGIQRKASTSCEITYTKDIRSIIYLDGLIIAVTQRTYGYGGKSYPIFELKFPEIALQDDMLSGGMMRIATSPSKASDYNILRNVNREVITFGDYEVVSVNLPNYRETNYAREGGETLTGKPGVISHIWVPHELHVAMLDWCRWHLTKNPAYISDFKRNTENF